MPFSQELLVLDSLWEVS